MPKLCSIYFDDADIKAIDALAENNKVSRNEMVKRLLRESQTLQKKLKEL